MKRLFFTGVIALLQFASFAQAQLKNYPQIGNVFPDFTFNDIGNFPQKSVKVSDFKGKYLILYFWGTSCIGCIKGMPGDDKLQRKYADSLQILPIGYNNNGSYVKSLFSEMVNQYKFVLPCAFDTTLSDRSLIDEMGYPQVIWIDKSGVVRAVSHGEFNEDNIRKFISGKEFNHEDASYSGQKQLQRKSILTKIETDGSNDKAVKDVEFSSTLKKWQPGMGMRISDLPEIGVDTLNKQEYSEYHTRKVTARGLFGVAYNGYNFDIFSPYTWPVPIFELTDSSKIASKGEELTFCYDLMVKRVRNSRPVLMKYMQNDLASYFGYKVSIQTRMMPCYVLTVSDSVKVKKLFSGDPTLPTRSLSQKGGKLNYTNVPFSGLMIYISAMMIDTTRFYDETGLKGRISLEFTGLTSDVNVLKDNLLRYGLSLSFTKRPVKVVVVND